MRRCLILAQAPGATSPQLPLMPRGRQLGPGLAAAGTHIPREQQWEAGLTQEALKPRFKQIPQKPPPLETQQYLLAPLPQLLLAEASCSSVQQMSLSSQPELHGRAGAWAQGETPGWGPRRITCPKGSPDRGEAQG